MSEKTVSPIIILGVFADINIESMRSEDTGDPILGDDGTPFTPGQAKAREDVELRAQAKQHALEIAALRFADMISRKGLIVEIGEPSEENGMLNFQFRMLAVRQNEDGSSSLEDYLRVEFNRAIDAAAEQVRKFRDCHIALSDILDMVSSEIEELKKIA